MTPLLFLLLGLIGIMGACPDTAAGRTLRRWLVETPARALARLTPRRLIGPTLLAAFGLLLFLLFEAEGLRLFAMALPEVVGWAVMFDVTVTLDLLAALLVVSEGARLRPVAAHLRRMTSGAARTFGVARRRAARAIRAAARRPSPSRNDDPEPWAAFGGVQAFG